VGRVWCSKIIRNNPIGVERCDDGNLANSDGCLDTCLPNVCGDGFVNAGVEECDDGDADDTNACVSGCRTARCGDGFVQAGVEECDDGNAVSADGCEPDCTRSTPCVLGDANVVAFGRCYMYFSIRVPWSTAEANCAAIGADLVSIEDASENALVSSLVSDDAWVGLNDRAPDWLVGAGLSIRF